MNVCACIVSVLCVLCAAVSECEGGCKCECECECECEREY
jgi:hypothetical protein